MPGRQARGGLARRAEIARNRVVILSMHANETYVAQALRAGIAGYLVKDAAATSWRRRWRGGSRRDLPEPRDLRHVVDGFWASRSPTPIRCRDDRAREIHQLIAEGTRGDRRGAGCRHQDRGNAPGELMERLASATSPAGPVRHPLGDDLTGRLNAAPRPAS
jgi:hypothetical protein